MTAVASVLWKCIDKPGHDSCQLRREASGWSLDGVSVFLDDSEPAMIAYLVCCNLQWEAISGRIHGWVGSRAVDHTVARRNGVWTLNDASVAGLEHLLDLDFSFTPATNLPQLRRISLPENESVETPVAWFDLRSGTLTRLPQIYQRQSERFIWYEAPTLGYRGLLEVDANGFVIRYPTLWEAEAAGR